MIGFLWLFAGMAVGLVNVLFLKVTLDRVDPQRGDKTWLWLGIGMVLRLALVLGVILLAVRQGFTQALFAFMGFWLIRWPLLFWLNKRSTPR